MTTVFYGYYYSWGQTLNQLKCIKTKDYLGGNVAYCCAEMLVYSERLDSDRDFKPNNLGYITGIFDNNSGPKLYLWATNKYKDLTEFIKKLCVCDQDVVQPEDIISYGSLVQEAMGEY